MFDWLSRKLDSTPYANEYCRQEALASRARSRAAAALEEAYDAAIRALAFDFNISEEDRREAERELDKRKARSSFYVIELTRYSRFNRDKLLDIKTDYK